MLSQVKLLGQVILKILSFWRRAGGMEIEALIKVEVEAKLGNIY